MQNLLRHLKTYRAVFRQVWLSSSLHPPATVYHPHSPVPPDLLTVSSLPPKAFPDRTVFCCPMSHYKSGACI